MKYAVKNPHDISLWLEHLEWLLENHPALASSLFEKNQLKEYLDKKVARAVVRSQQLQKKGMDQEQALEVVREDLISPANGPALLEDNPPELSPQLRKKIMVWAESDFPPNVVRITA